MRRFPPPWITQEHNHACFIVKDATAQALAYFYFEDEPLLTAIAGSILAVAGFLVACLTWMRANGLRP